MEGWNTGFGGMRSLYGKDDIEQGLIRLGGPLFIHNIHFSPFPYSNTMTQLKAFNVLKCTNIQDT